MDRKLFLTIVRYNPKYVLSEFVISGVDCMCLCLREATGLICIIYI